MSIGKPYLQQQPSRYGKKALKLLGTLTVAVIVIGLWAATHGEREPRNLEEFLQMVEQRGGELVRCEANVCTGLASGQHVGEGPDGLYLSYAPGAVSDAELQRQAALLKKLLAATQQQQI